MFQKSEDASKTLDEYRRVLYLSLEDSKTLSLKEEVIFRALFECSVSLFEHICVCLRYLSDEAEFYVARLVRPCYYAVLIGKEDTDITIVTEYYKYRYDGINQIAHPDLLFIEKVTSKHCHVYPLYKSYLSDLENPDEFMISKKYLSLFMEKSGDYFTNYIIDKKLEGSSKSFQKILEEKKKLYKEIFENYH